MPIQLDLDQMREIIEDRIDPEIGGIYRNQMEALANAMAVTIRSHLDPEIVETGKPYADKVGFGGTCVPFRPAIQGAEIPELIAGYDDEGWE